MLFYTHVHQHWDKIHVRGYDNGRRFNDEVEYRPYMFEEHPDGQFKTIDGRPVRKIPFSSISAARKYNKLFEGVENKTIYGLSNFLYLYIYDTYGTPGEWGIKFDPALISVVSIDIEVAADAGFPDVRAADKEITAITMRKRGKSVVFGCKYYKEKSDDVTYVLCKDEPELLDKFIQAWTYLDPDVVTGWNIEFFDIPYIVNRITRLLGGEAAKRLSPWRMLEEREIESMGSRQQAFVPVGVTILDYMRIYKKFSLKNQESYSLNNIASVELGEKKLDYAAYGSLLDLYKKDYELFIDYNIHDTVLIDKLEEKLGYIQLVFTMAYDAKVNYLDTLGTTRVWDTLIHSYLMNKGIVVPPNRDSHGFTDLMGGFVKEPIIGMHDWVVSFDLNSLYMHLVMQYNISPDTFVTRLGTKAPIDEILNHQLITEEFHKNLTDNNCSLTANMCLFTNEKRGFLPEIAEKIYNDRDAYKKKMLELKKEFERTKDPETEKLYNIYKNLQGAKKVQLNSGYGALANEYYRWYNFDFAEAITSSGQLSIRWVEKWVNWWMNKELDTQGVDYVVASDTDSIYVRMDGLVKKHVSHETDAKITEWLDIYCDDIMQVQIDRAFKTLARMMNAYEQKMKMKREKISNRAIWKAAKMYVLNVCDSEKVRYAEPQVEVTGIESVRSSTPLVARTYIKEALKIIMNQDEKSLIKYVADKRTEFKTKPFNEVAFPRSVKFKYSATMNRSAGVYTLDSSALPIQVRAALLYNRRVKEMGLPQCPLINSDEKIKFTYLKMPNPIGENVIAAPSMLPHELGLDAFIDYETQFEKSFLEPILKITDIIGWQAEKRASLEGLI